MTPGACADRAARRRVVALATVIGLAAACAPAVRVLLPDPSRATADAAGYRTVAALADACGAVTTMTANAGVSGRVAGRRVRGTLQVGTARPGRVRIDAVAPFGAPIFTLASDGTTTTLVLPREQAFVRGASVAQLLDALIQVPLSADDLAAVLLACPRTPLDDERSRVHAGGDVSATDADGVTAFARSAPVPRLFGLLFPTSDQRARRIAIAYAAPASPARRQIDVEVGAAPAAAQLRLTLSDIETGVALGPDAFVAVIQPGARELALGELRRISPFGEAPRTP
jgi:outer membrane lipoprotein-sorting protein